MDTSKPTESYFSVPRWFLDLRNHYNRAVWQRAYRRAQARAIADLPVRPIPNVQRVEDVQRPHTTPKATAATDASPLTLGPDGTLPPAPDAMKGARRSLPWDD